MKISNKTKQILTYVALAVLIVASVAFVGTLIFGGFEDSDYKTTNITWDVGGILNDGQYDRDEKGALYTKDLIRCTGFELYADFNSDNEVMVYFYDDTDSFIESRKMDGLEYKCEDFPKNAVGIRIVLTPLDDEDGKIGLFEKGEYANQLTVKLRTTEVKSDEATE